MAKKEQKIEVEGIVRDVLPNSTYRVEVERTRHLVLAYASGKMKEAFIRIFAGDRVKLELSPYDPTRGRIVWRYR